MTDEARPTPPHDNDLQDSHDHHDEEGTPDKEYVLNLFQRAHEFQALAATENPGQNLRRAIDLYAEGLNYIPPSLASAGLQYNIGLAYVELSRHEDDVQHIQRAIRAFETALEIRTPNGDRVDYIVTQMNRAICYEWLARHENVLENLQKALEAHQKTIEFCSPLDHASYYYSEQMNVGNVYHELSRLESREANLAAALAAYAEALTFYSPQNYPLGYAIVKLNAGLVHRDLGNAATAVTHWREAEHYLRQAGRADSADQLREWIREIAG